MTAVTHPTMRRQRSRFRSIGATALLAAATIALAQRQPATPAPHRAAAPVAAAPHAASAELYATALTP